MPVSAANQRYAIHVLTDKSLDADEFAPSFLASWLHGNPRLAPEYFGHGEPVRSPITGVDELVREWRKPPALMFKRRSSPKFLAEMTWRQGEVPDPGSFPWGIKVWLDREAGDDLVFEFFQFLIGWFEPAFARVTSIAEANRKHLAVYPFYEGGKRIGTAEQFVGTGLSNRIPGIYWLTYLSDRLINPSTLHGIRKFIVSRNSRGVLLRTHENAKDIGSQTARRIENDIVEAIGSGRFFNIDEWISEQENV